MEKWSIQTILNKYLTTKFKNKRTEDFWRGSEMGRCLRMRIYSKRKVPKTEEMTLQLMRKLETGNIFHWYYQQRLEDLGIMVAKEHEFIDEKLKYIGHCDAIVNIGKIKNVDLDNKPDNWFTNYLKGMKKEYSEMPDSLLLYDFKTIHSLAFTYLEKNGAPQKHHVLQVASYLNFAKKEFPELREGRILLISKDDLRIIEFPIKLTKELEKRIFWELETLNRHEKEKTLPERLPLLDLSNKKQPSINWECRFCPYSSFCRGKKWQEEAKMQLLDFLKTGKIKEEIKEIEKPKIPSLDFSKI